MVLRMQLNQAWMQFCMSSTPPSNRCGRPGRFQAKIHQTEAALDRYLIPTLPSVYLLIVVYCTIDARVYRLIDSISWPERLMAPTWLSRLEGLGVT